MLRNKIIRALPNTLTTLRLVLVAPFAVLLVNDQYFAAATTYAVALLTDLDGTIARKLKATSKFGSIYDPVVDITFLIIALSALVMTGGVEAITVGIYFTGFCLKVPGAAKYYKANHQVRWSIWSKIAACFGIGAVLAGTLQFGTFANFSLVCGAFANAAVGFGWILGPRNPRTRNATLDPEL